jgi:DNA repair protein RadC
MTPLPRFTIRPVYESSSLQEEPPLVIGTPEDASNLFYRTIRHDPTFEEYKEHVIVIVVNSRMQLIGYNIVSVGTSDECALYISETLRAVIVAGQRYFYLMHNHPSGLVSPSISDRRITDKLKEASNLLELRLIDHLIVGKVGCYSFREHGLI